jgi:hypothetical protein
LRPTTTGRASRLREALVHGEVNGVKGARFLDIGDGQLHEKSSGHGKPLEAYLQGFKDSDLDYNSSEL